MTTIAVIGATGKLGRLVVEHLLTRVVAPAEVVAVVRTPAKASDLAARGVDIRYGDYSEPATLAAALAGVDVLLLISGSSDNGKLDDQHGEVITAAKDGGVQRIVYTSTLRAGRTHLALAEEHLATEKLLQGCGLRYTILRNGPYIENYTSRIGQILTQGEIVGATTGQALTAATRNDYAEAAAAALIEDGHAGAIYELGGTPFTMPQLAAAITDAAGTPVIYRDIPGTELRALLISRGVPEIYAGFFVELEESAAIGAQYTNSGDLQRLIGRPSTSLTDAAETAVRHNETSETNTHGTNMTH